MTEKNIEKLAELAKIRISGKEKQSFLNDFESILNYIKQIESVDVTETQNNFLLKNMFREDINPNKTGALTKALLACAPETHDGFIKVNKIL